MLCVETDRMDIMNDVVAIRIAGGILIEEAH